MLNNFFESQYAKGLGIYDHCIEIVRLKDDIRSLKGIERYEAAEIVGRHMVNEMMDLCLILNEMFGNEISRSDYQELLDLRKQKFVDLEAREKGGSENA